MENKIKEIFSNVCENIDLSTENLVTNNIIDSVQIVELVTMIMEELNIEIPYEEITPQNFNSLKDIINISEKYK